MYRNIIGIGVHNLIYNLNILVYQQIRVSSKIKLLHAYSSKNSIFFYINIIEFNNDWNEMIGGG